MSKFGQPIEEQVDASMCIKCKDNIEGKVKPDCSCAYRRILVSWILDMLPVERADTKIDARFDTYHIGYNDAIKEMHAVFGILNCKNCVNYNEFVCNLRDRDDCYAYSKYKDKE